MPPIDVLGKTKARLLAMGALMAGGTLAGAIADLASQMKNRRQRPSSFVEIDLADRIATSGYTPLLSLSENICHF